MHTTSFKKSDGKFKKKKREYLFLKCDSLSIILIDLLSQKEETECPICNPTSTSANCILGLCLLVSKEQPWLPLMFQQ